MEVKLKRNEQWVIVDFEGRLDSFNFDLFSKKVSTLIKMGKTLIAIDLSGTTFINVQSLRFLISTSEHLNKKNGYLVLLSPHEKILQHIRKINHPQILNIHDHLAEVSPARNEVSP